MNFFGLMTKQTFRPPKRNKDQKLRCRQCGKYTYVRAFLTTIINGIKTSVAVTLIDKGCSQNYVADLLGVSSSTVAKWINPFYE